MKGVHWMIENRGGMAFFTGLLIVQSQFGPSSEENERIIDEASHHAPFKIEKFRLPVKDGTTISGIIYYPPGWNPEDKSRCVAFHNPNGANIADFFDNRRLAWTVGDVVALRQCPIVMYDYRGAGLSQDNYRGSLKFYPTYASIVEDGVVALAYVLKHFETAEVWGSSLGGGVAAKALALHLKANPDHVNRVEILSHDSFSTTSRVIIPGWPRTADWLGWTVGGHIDAEAAIIELVAKGVKVTILCHTDDPVIPAGARMADRTETPVLKNRVRVICCPGRGHAFLTRDMIAALKAK